MKKEIFATLNNVALKRFSVNFSSKRIRNVTAENKKNLLHSVSNNSSIKLEQ